MHLHPVGFQLGEGPGGPQHRSAAAHVVFHHFDLGARRLEVVAAGIEGEAFAHQHNPALHRPGGPVGEVDEFRGQIGALGNAEVGPHAEGCAVGALQQLQLPAEVARNGGGGVGQVLGGGHVGGGGHQLPRQFNSGADGPHPCQ